MYVSRLKTGEKNVQVIESIFILNNILVNLRDNEILEEYLEDEDFQESDFMVDLQDVNDDGLPIEDHELSQRSTAELAKGKRKRLALLNHLKSTNKLFVD